MAQSWREATPETKAYYEQRATRINAVEEKKYLQQIRARREIINGNFICLGIYETSLCLHLGLIYTTNPSLSYTNTFNQVYNYQPVPLTLLILFLCLPYSPTVQTSFKHAICSKGHD